MCYSIAMRLPSIIKEQSDGFIEVHLTKEIETLNNFLPSKTAIANCQKKGVDWKFLADIWAKYKRQWEGALSVFPKVERKKRIVDTIIISRRTRLIDLENLYGGSKPIRDTLQRRGWLYDDAPKWGGLHIIQEKVSKDQVGTIIQLRKQDETNRREDNL